MHESEGAPGVCVGPLHSHLQLVFPALQTPGICQHEWCSAELDCAEGTVSLCPALHRNSAGSTPGTWMWFLAPPVFSILHPCNQAITTVELTAMTKLAAP